MDLNPTDIVTVTDLTPETVRKIIAHLEVSTDFDHLVYREAELNAIWSIAGFVLQNEPNPEARQVAEDLRRISQEAHDLLAERRPWDAAAVLRDFL